MGFVWNVMLSFDNDEMWEDGEEEARETCEPLDRINAWLNHGRLVSLIKPTYDDDSGYGMDANLYGGGFKHFDIEGFIEVVQAQNWKVRLRSSSGSRGPRRAWAPSRGRSSSSAVGGARQQSRLRPLGSDGRPGSRRLRPTSAMRLVARRQPPARQDPASQATQSTASAIRVLESTAYQRGRRDCAIAFVRSFPIP